MKPRRGPALAIALLTAAFASAGCGAGAGEEVGEASLTVSRDYGVERILGPAREPVEESDTVMRLLDREAEVSTRYGGGFVSSIEGLAEAVEDGRRYDWFFYVNGVEAPVGAAEFDLGGGEAVWWDYRAWTAASRVPAVVGSFPRPLAGGYEGRERPVALECRGAGAACGLARLRLRRAGVRVGAYDRYANANANAGREEGPPAAAGRPPAGAIRVLVGPWARLRSDPAAAQLERGPQVSGVFAELVRSEDGYGLVGVDEDGQRARRFGRGAGIVAATRRNGAPPVWLLTGPTARGALAAARSLDSAALRDRYAVAVEGDAQVPLPLPGGPR
ncbi:MAG: DUF4430 domain-containing protein [Solirubrobacterales bacterium]